MTPRNTFVLNNRINGFVLFRLGREKENIASLGGTFESLPILYKGDDDDDGVVNGRTSEMWLG